MTLGKLSNSEYERLELAAVKKQNELLDLDIELKKIKVERRKLALKILMKDNTR